jgi:hypothetical protein
MYTYGGDATLDGKIDVDDYGRIDLNAPIPGASGWSNGDFNYDGKINIDDYAIIDLNVGIQGAPFPTGSGTSVPLSSSSAISAVPEPATTIAGVTFIALSSLLRTRRRKRRLAVSAG